MRFILFIAILLGLCSCARFEVASAFQPYLQPADVRRTIVEFGYLPPQLSKRGAGEANPGKLVAYCWRYEWQNLIHVDRKGWSKLNDDERRWLLHHELGHCEKDLEHDLRLDKRGCPASAMYPWVPAPRCLAKNKKSKKVTSRSTKRT